MLNLRTDNFDDTEEGMGCAFSGFCAVQILSKKRCFGEKI